MDIQPLLQHFRRLDTEQKLELLAQLWAEIAADPDALNVTDEQRRLIDERLRQHEESPDDVVGWDDVKAEAQQRLAVRKP